MASCGAGRERRNKFASKTRVDDSTLSPGYEHKDGKIVHHLRRTIDVASHNGNTSHVYWLKRAYQHLLKLGSGSQPRLRSGCPRIYRCPILSSERVD